MDNFMASFLEILQLTEGFEEKMEKALEYLVVRNGFESGHLLLFEPVGRRTYHCAAQGFGGNNALMELKTENPMFEEIRKACADVRESVTIDEYAWKDRAPGLRELHGSLKDLEAGSVLLPLWTREDLLGVIKLVGHQGAPAPAPEQRAFLNLVGRQMGKELARELLLFREEALVRERQSLLDIGKTITSGLDLDEVLGRIASISAQRMRVGDLAVILLDEGMRAERAFIMNMGNFDVLDLEDLAMDMNVMGDSTRKMMEEKKAFYIEDARTDPRTNNDLAKVIDMVSVLGVPINGKDRGIGFIVMHEPGQHHYFSDEDVRFMEGIAAYATIAIENARLFRKSRDQQERLADLMLRLAQAREEERSRISRELHDSMAQTLLEIIYKAENLLAGEAGALLEEELRGMLSSSRSSLTELRRIITDLRPSSVEVLGLPQALHNLLERFAVTHGIKVDAEIDIDPGFRLDSLYENSLYRMVSAVLDNIARHAGAGRVDFLLRLEEGCLRLWMSDNGPGVDLSSPLTEELRQGLVVLRERAETIGGILEISLEPGKGGTMTLTIPLSDPEHP